MNGAARIIQSIPQAVWPGYGQGMPCPNSWTYFESSRIICCLIAPPLANTHCYCPPQVNRSHTFYGNAIQFHNREFYLFRYIHKHFIFKHWTFTVKLYPDQPSYSSSSALVSSFLLTSICAGLPNSIHPTFSAQLLTSALYLLWVCHQHVSLVHWPWPS